MHEYDAKFVNPRINYARRDVSTMTNEAEMVDLNYWRPRHGSARKSAANGRMPRSSTSSDVGMRNW